jgi:quinol monooxygenase YgiN
MKLAGVTQEQFDAVNATIDPASDPPAGAIFHLSGPIDEGWHVIDVWESRAAFDAFQEARIQPALAAAGVQMQGPPDITEFEVHEMFIP